MLAVLIVVMMGFAALPTLMFGHPATENAAGIGPNVVKVGWRSEIVIWNPMTIEMVEDYVAAYLVYSCLFTFDQDWNNVVGDLARSWNQTVNPDGSMVTWVNITHNAYFRSKANPLDTTHKLTARDVVFTYELILNNTGGSWNYYLENVTDVIAVDDYTVRIDTDYSKVTIFDDLTNIPIVPEYIWNDPGTTQGRNPYGGLNPGDNVGSGPFLFDSWLRGSWYKFATAPNYHGNEIGRTVKIDGILYTVYADASALTLAMNSGTEDTIVLTGDVNVFRTVLGGAGTKVHITKAPVQEAGITDIAINAVPLDFRTTGYDDGWNQRDKGGKLFLLDPFVRKAIMMTLNKTYIVDNILFGLATKADSVVPPTYWHKVIDNQLPFDPPAAKQVLIDHGYIDTNGDGIQEVTSASMAYKEGWAAIGDSLTNIRCQAPNTDSSWGVIAETWAGWAHQAGLGFTSTVDNEVTMINQAWYKAYYDIWVWHWGWNPEPLNYILGTWKTSELYSGGNNVQMPMGPWWYGPSNQSSSPTGTPYSAFDENLTAALHTLDRTDRKVIVDKLQQWIYDSYTENPPVYDLGLYAYTNYRYDGWGDWQVHVGRSVASTLVWLWFDLMPAANRSPFFNIPPDDAYDILKDSPKTFSVTVSDPDGDPLLVNWSFGDGGTAQSSVGGDTKVPQVVSVTHTYTALATGLGMNVSVWDQQPSHEVKVPSRVNVVSTPNLGPVIVSTYFTPPSPVYINVPTTWSISARDNESGTSHYGLLFTIAWGDGTYDVYRKDPLKDNVVYNFTRQHTWTTPGLYNVRASVWDGFDVETNTLHNVTWTQAYRVIENTPPSNPDISAMDGIEGIPIPCQAQSTDADPDGLRFTWNWSGASYDVLNYPPNAGSPITSTVLHTWATPGDYTVTVYVDDGQGHNVSSSRVAHILPSGSPVPPGSVSLTMYPDPGKAGTEVWVNVSASDANQDPLEFYLDFEDGGTALATTLGGTTGLQYVNISHTYGDAGTYTITVHVNDSFADGTHNVSSLFNVEILVANSPPTFSLQSSYTAFYNQTFEITPITISDPDGDALSVWYTWGDNSPLSLSNSTYGGTHVYNRTATFTMTVAVDDGNGHNVTATGSVTVMDGNLKPTIETWQVGPLKAKYVTDETVWFNMTVKDYEGDTVNITIDFGDDSPVEVKEVALTPDTNSSIQSFTHAYSVADANGYSVRVTVMDGKDHSNMTWATSTAKIIVEKKSGGGISMAAIGAIAAIAILALIVAVLLLTRRKKKPEESGAGGMEGMAPPEEPPPPKK